LGLGLVLAVAVYAGCTTEEEGNGDDDDQVTTSSTTTTSSTGTTTGAGTGTPSGGTSTGSYIECSVDVSNIDGECDLLNHDCPPDQWCTIQGTFGPLERVCAPFLGGLKPAGSVCDSTSECGFGLRCIGDKCTAVCCRATGEPCGPGACDVRVSYSSTQWAYYCSYNDACTLFANECPQQPEPFDCHVSEPDQGLAVCDDRSDQWGGEGQPCVYRNDCGDSQRCNRQAPDVDADAGVQGRCRYHCHVAEWQSETEGNGGCPANQHCVDLAWAALPNIGLCIPD
jgi:hypothetical protein